MVIKESQPRQSAPGVGVPTPDNPLGLYFVQYRCSLGGWGGGWRQLRAGWGGGARTVVPVAVWVGRGSEVQAYPPHLPPPPSGRPPPPLAPWPAAHYLPSPCPLLAGLIRPTCLLPCVAPHVCCMCHPPPPTHPPTLAGRLEKLHSADGSQRLAHYFLEDQHGRQHLAVVGEERETRDGHYLYSAVGCGGGGRAGG